MGNCVVLRSGMEVAAYLVSKARSVTVVGRGRIPFSSLGDRVGVMLLNVSDFLCDCLGHSVLIFRVLICKK